MKFNEKLIELRRKAGLSQEELGYKLNVTRQTVSKWELGQTTPEMDKLIEMGNVFNVSVDDLINDSEVATNVNPIIEDQPIGNAKTKNKTIIIVIVIALIVVVMLMMFKIFSAFSMFNKVTDGITNNQENAFGKLFGFFNQAVEEQEEMIENSNNKINLSIFNGTLELYKGSNNGTQLKSLLDEVITKNKKEERKITVIYNDIETQDTEEINNLKINIKESNNFDATFDYDEQGYVNKVTIKRVVTEMEIRRFNGSLELYAGTGKGLFVTTALDKVITSNKTEERKITVKYNELETQNEEEIKNIKKNFETMDEFDISYEYDADGFINKVIIEKL